MHNIRPIHWPLFVLGRETKRSLFLPNTKIGQCIGLPTIHVSTTDEATCGCCLCARIRSLHMTSVSVKLYPSTRLHVIFKSEYWWAAFILSWILMCVMYCRFYLRKGGYRQYRRKTVDHHIIVLHTRCTLNLTPHISFLQKEGTEIEEWWIVRLDCLF